MFSHPRKKNIYVKNRRQVFGLIPGSRTPSQDDYDASQWLTLSGAFDMEITAAGLSGILTRFPLFAQWRTDGLAKLVIFSEIHTI